MNYFSFSEHVRGLRELVDFYDQEAREHHQRHDNKKADICLTKKKLALKEVNHLASSTLEIYLLVLS